ncbi:MAG: hypothetical protein ACR2M4_13735 [Actinomycetota bacterium]
MNQVTIETTLTADPNVSHYHVYLNGEHVTTSLDINKALNLKAELEQPLGCTDDESVV